MSRVESSVTIGAPPEAIQAALENVETAHEWAPSLQKVWDVQGRGVGCTYKWTFKLGPASFNGSTDITESTPERFVMKTTGGIPSIWTWQMAPAGKGTELRVAIEYTVPGSTLGTLVDKLVVEKQNRKELEASLVTLKAKLEQ